MARRDAGKVEYEKIKVFGHAALFSDLRISKESVPEGWHCYEVRHDDECLGIPCEIAGGILVNFWGTVLSPEPLLRANETKRFIGEEEWEYVGESGITIPAYSNVDDQN